MLSDDGIRTVVSEALMKALGQEQRDALITKAVETLITPEKDSYGRPGKSQLEKAFENGVYLAAQLLVREKFEEEDFKAKIRAVIADAAEKFLVSNRQETVDALAKSLSDGVKFVSQRY